MAKVCRVNDLANDALNISLESYKSPADGVHTLSHEDWQRVIQVRILRELKKLNALLACPNFTGIPLILVAILHFAASYTP